MSSPEEHFEAVKMDLREFEFTADLLSVVPGEYARRYRMLPVSTSPGRVCLALSDPSDIQAIEIVRQLLDVDVEVCVADAKQLDEFIERLYGSDHESGS
jgi:type IV pilus assembly protein PilB